MFSQYMCHFEMNSKKLKLKGKTLNKKKKIHGYFLIYLVLYFPTNLPTYGYVWPT